MSGSRCAGGYANLLRRRAVARTFVPAPVGRLTYGVLPLSLIFTVQHATGSFSIAATTMALNGLATLAMPLKSRAIDRYGQRLVIPLITAIMVAVLLVTTALAHTHVPDALTWLALGLTVGLASPPLGPCMRAQWRVLVPEQMVARAYALDAVGEETLYLVGPMIAAGILALCAAYAGLLLCAVLVCIGAAALAASPAAAATSVSTLPRAAVRGPLRHVPFLELLAMMVAVGAVTATVNTGTAARALAAGHPSLAGIADASVAVGSVAGGLIWGRLQPACSAARSIAGLLLLIGTAALVASAVEPFWLFTCVLTMGGLAIAPMYVVAYRTSDRLVDAEEVTEASAWVNTVTNLGISLGSAAAGFLVGHAGDRAPGWAGGSLALAAASAIAIAHHRSQPASEGHRGYRSKVRSLLTRVHR